MASRRLPSSWRRRRRIPWRRMISPLLLVGLWQLASSRGWVDEHTLASPGRVAATARDLWSGGELQHHLAVSLARVAQGLALGVTAGVALALLAGLSRVGEELVGAPPPMLRTSPGLG